MGGGVVSLNRLSGQRRKQKQQELVRRDPESEVNTNTSNCLPGNPLILPRDKHNISRKNIDHDALKVMSRLLRHGYRAFLVGGAVRDLLLGKTPKDFDIGTDARPETVRSLFRNSRIIGRRFRINHVFFTGNKIFEVSTFRDTQELDSEANGTIAKSDNTYGDPQTDALRRDLTINGLFYDLANFSVIDYVGGIEDLKNGIIRIIGEPELRFEEDPVRMIRVIRHAARTGFSIEEKTYSAICKLNHLITLSSSARVFEELLRELRGGYAMTSFRMMYQAGLLSHLMPVLSETLDNNLDVSSKRLESVLGLIDRWTLEGNELPVSVLFLAIYIGSLPQRFFEQNVSEEHYKLSMLLFADGEHLVQQLKSAENTNPTDEEDSNVVGTGSSHKYQKLSKHQVANSISKTVNDVFRPIGVSRKDREQIEELLYARYLLFYSFVTNTFDIELTNRHYYRDSILLFTLLSGEPTTKNCLNFWLDTDHTEGEQRRGKKRKRRRSRRRRKPQLLQLNEQS